MEKTTIIEKSGVAFEARVMTGIKAKLVPFLVSILAIIIGRSNYLIVGIFSLVLGVVLWRIIIWNVYFILKLEIRRRELSLIYLKFNKIKHIHVQIEDVDVKIAPVHIIKKKYKLKLYKKERMILKQFEIRDWSERDFDFVNQNISRLKFG